MMKPKHSLLFLLGLFLVFSLIIIFAPPGGFKLFDTVRIKTPHLTDFFDTSSKEAIPDTSMQQILSLSQTMLKEPDTLAFVPAKKESIVVIADSANIDTVVVNSEMFDVKNIKIQSIEFPSGKNTLLDPFFKLLAIGSADTSIVRIMHYGDSQIERDRVTSYLRNMFQSKFGGSGPGLMPAFQPYGKLLSVYHEASENWKRFTTFGKVDYSLGHKRYGPMAAVSKIGLMPDQEDSVYRAHITVRKNRYAYKSIQRYTQCQLLLGNCYDTVMVQFVADDLTLQTDRVVPNYLKKISCSFPDFTKELTIHFKSHKPVELYGMMVQSKHGVIVDNIAMRGSSGLEFSRMDADHLKAAYAYLNPKLVILEFGGNIAPTEAKNYNFYGRMLLRELTLLKKLLPNVPFIVIGIADMSKKQGDQYISYPNLIKIRDEMKKASFQAGCAYWDLMSAMGGENSMPKWVAAKPPLATKDYVHLTDLGARVMGKMFCAALNKEYEDYIKKMK